MDDSFDNESHLSPLLPDTRALCRVLSYVYNFHVALAKFVKLSPRALPYLEINAEDNPFEEYCQKDPDFVEMFNLLDTLRPLGLRGK